MDALFVGGVFGLAFLGAPLTAYLIEIIRNRPKR